MLISQTVDGGRDILASASRHSAPEESSITGDQFRSLMGSFPTGVSVVTSCSEAGLPLGYTASSVASVSLDPPILLVCAARHLYTLAAIRRSETFAVNFLGDENEALARRFSSQEPDKFAEVDYKIGKLGVPLLSCAVGNAECRVQDFRDVGDHVVIFGRIVSAHIAADQRPLVYFRGGFFGGPRR